jgi:hypothetical protein
MVEAPKTRRRWFQFGLGTMLLVAPTFGLALAWAAYNLHWIRERQDALSECLVQPHWAAPPGLLGVFGERGYGFLILRRDDDDIHRPLTDAEEQKQRRIAALFPEAEVRWTTAHDYLWQW